MNMFFHDVRVLQGFWRECRAKNGATSLAFSLFGAGVWSSTIEVVGNQRYRYIHILSLSPFVALIFH